MTVPIIQSGSDRLEELSRPWQGLNGYTELSKYRDRHGLCAVGMDGAEWVVTIRSMRLTVDEALVARNWLNALFPNNVIRS